MVIDTSALLAIVLAEPECETFLRRLEAAGESRISAATYLEAGIVLLRDRTGERRLIFEELLTEFRIVIVPVTEQQARAALEAFREFGKGRGHPASLNFGDCFSYALAKLSGESLLFKGEDFAKTDVSTA